jgi:dienelactone hydrolase
MLALLLAAAPALWGGLPAGPHPVGFRVIGHRDATRPLADGTPRPLQISLWYPAAAASQPALTYRDLVLVAAAESTLLDPTPAQAETALGRYRGFLSRNGVPEAGIAAWLAAPLLARRDAPPAAGRFPLVLLGQGNGGAVQDQAVLGEVLASHGFVVATTPSPLRLGAPMESEADVLPVAEENAKDLAAALSVLRGERFVDAHRIGIVGYSFGARSALLLAARTAGVKALVSLDGGIGMAEAAGWLQPSPQAPGLEGNYVLDPKAIDRNRFRVPLLHVYEETDEAMKPDFTLLDSLRRSAQLRLRVQGMHHLDLITFGLAQAALPELGRSPEEARALSAIHQAVFPYALRFLQAHVLGDREARRFLERDPVANGFSKELLKLTRRPAR